MRKSKVLKTTKPTSHVILAGFSSFIWPLGFSHIDDMPTEKGKIAKIENMDLI